MSIERKVEVTPIGKEGKKCLPPDPDLSYTQKIDRKVGKDGVMIIEKVVDSRDADKGK